MSDGPSPLSTNFSVVPDQVRDVGTYVYELSAALRSALDSAGKDVYRLTEGG
ncbi:hypothetical protein [Nocardia sp. NPDC005366]|uniref:hypothetical protein n=1 Tax=Nocardia sp. NPDC005366 TaxID=3156878 RepID=UPI0033B61466